jgi:hypothetical protein
MDQPTSHIICSHSEFPLVDTPSHMDPIEDRNDLRCLDNLSDTKLG